MCLAAHKNKIAKKLCIFTYNNINMYDNDVDKNIIYIVYCKVM